MFSRRISVVEWTKSLLMLTSALTCLAVGAPAAAEWFGDFYLGGAFTEKHDVDTNSVTTLDVRFDKSFAGGARGGPQEL